jgi:hypothetical protein
LKIAALVTSPNAFFASRKRSVSPIRSLRWAWWMALSQGLRPNTWEGWRWEWGDIFDNSIFQASFRNKLPSTIGRSLPLGLRRATRVEELRKEASSADSTPRRILLIRATSWSLAALASMNIGRRSSRVQASTPGAAPRASLKVAARISSASAVSGRDSSRGGSVSIFTFRSGVLKTGLYRLPIPIRYISVLYRLPNR